MSTEYMGEETTIEKFSIDGNHGGIRHELWDIRLDDFPGI